MQGLSAELSTTESEDFHSALPATVFPDSRDIFVDDKNKTGTAQYPTHLSTQLKLTTSASRSLHAPTLPSCLPCFPSHHLLPCLPSHRLLSAVPPTVSVVHGRRAYCTLCRCPRAWWPLLPSLSMQSACMQGRADIPKFSSHAVYGQIMVPSSKFTEHAVASKFQIHRACSRICRLQKACSLPIPNS